MTPFGIPQWIKPHLYLGKNLTDLTAADKEQLKIRLDRFKAPDPEVSVVIPVWNEENNIYRTLSSLSASTTNRRVEFVVINNNSTDRTQEVLDNLGLTSYFQPIQGTAPARQLGLEKAKGSYHLCADADSFYPPDWIDLMIKPLEKNNGVVGVYGRYSFIPPPGDSRLFLVIYETLTGLLVRLRKSRREHINFLGFNMGFIAQIGRESGGFNVKEVRRFDNALGSEYYIEESEDGRMAVNLKKRGRLELITDPRARVFTSSRRLIAEGGIWTSFVHRMKIHTRRMSDYINGGKVE